MRFLYGMHTWRLRKGLLQGHSWPRHLQERLNKRCAPATWQNKATPRRNPLFSCSICHVKASAAWEETLQPSLKCAQAATMNPPCLLALIICGHAAGAASPGAAMSSASADAMNPGASALLSARAHVSQIF